MKQLLTSLGVSDVENLDLGPLTLESVLVALFTLLLCVIAGKLLLSLFRKLLAKADIEEQARRYALGAIRVVLWVVTVLIVADALGIPITSLVALLSVFSLAVSLAVQSVLSNIAGGIVLMLNKPFKEGDYVETSSGSGTVQDITLNYTYLDTADGRPDHQLYGTGQAPRRGDSYRILRCPYRGSTAGLSQRRSSCRQGAG